MTFYKTDLFTYFLLFFFGFFRNSVQRPQQQFASTKLVRNVENRGGQSGGRHGPYDHRDRAMHQVVRNRNYSGFILRLFFNFV